MRLKRYNRTPVDYLSDIPFFDGLHGVGMYFFKEGDMVSDAYYSNKEMFGQVYPVVVEVADSNIVHLPSIMDDYWAIKEIMYHEKRTCFRVRSKVGGKYEYIVTDIDSIVIVRNIDTYPVEDLSYDEDNKTIRGSKSNICYATIDHGV